MEAVTKLMRKPDFIIIGAMKSATSTLHNQLSAQPGVFMSTPKEPNFFSDDAVYKKGLDWYSGLFAEAADTDLCGESSTHYTKLPDYPKTVERLKQYIENPKFIYVMRHPVDRLVSHYMHQWSEGVINCDINQAIDRYPELIAYSCYGMQIKPYIEAFGRDAILPVFFDALKAAPQATLVSIGAFIGVPRASVLQWNDNEAPDNVSKQRIRRFYGYDLLINSAPMTWLRRTLIPKTMRERVKGRLTMAQRPEISPSQRDRIVEIFDRDFLLLRDWLNLELTCENFNQIGVAFDQNQIMGRK